jgi:hypothetical protein
MVLILVEIEQFEWEGNVLIHLPTGAAFAWQNGKTYWCSVTPWRARNGNSNQRTMGWMITTALRSRCRQPAQRIMPQRGTT